MHEQTTEVQGARYSPTSIRATWDGTGSVGRLPGRWGSRGPRGTTWFVAGSSLAVCCASAVAHVSSPRPCSVCSKAESRSTAVPIPDTARRSDPPRTNPAGASQRGFVVSRALTTAPMTGGRHHHRTCADRQRLSLPKTTWRQTCRDLGISPRWARPWRPQTIGKVECFHRTLLEEWGPPHPRPRRPKRPAAIQR